MNGPVNQPTIVSGSELKTPDKKKNSPSLIFALEFINIFLILGSCGFLANAAISLIRGDTFLGVYFLVIAAGTICVAVGFYGYMSITRTIMRLSCHDITARKLQPLFPMLKRWKKVPSIKGNLYYATASTLSIFRAYLGDTDTAVREHREIVSEYRAYLGGGQGRLLSVSSDVTPLMLSNLGNLLILNNEFAEAEQKLEESIAIYESSDKKSMGEVYPRNDLARIMIDRLAFEDALHQLDLAAKRMNDNTDTTLVYLNIDIENIICKAYSAVCQFKLGRDDAGNQLTEEVITLLPTGPTSWTFIGAIHAISLLANVLIERGEITNAEQIVYMSSACLTCETHPDFFEFKAVSDNILKRIESNK